MNGQISSAELIASLSYRAASAEQFLGFPHNLSLLKTIESMLEAIRVEQSVIDKYAEIFMDSGDKLMANFGSEIIDQDGSFFSLLLNAQKAIQKTHKGITSWCSESTEYGLDRFYEDLLDEVTRFTDSLSSFHNYLNALRVSVANHDAKCSKVIAVFDSSDDLRTFLKSA